MTETEKRIAAIADLINGTSGPLPITKAYARSVLPRMFEYGDATDRARALVMALVSMTDEEWQFFATAVLDFTGTGLDS